MDFDEAKENIQPLASGRNAERLEAALHAESHHEIHEQIIEQRREFERAIDSYNGDDPLEIWYDYIQWIEQSYPKSGKETALNDVIMTCLAKFENEERYKQDRRMIKLFIKYIDSEPNPHEYYELLYNNGIGTMVADLYLCWAHYYDYNDNFEKADSVYQKGLDARAQPLDQLEQAHKQFGFSMSQRLLHKDASTREKFLSLMDEQRLALTSLRRHVGSIRTGSSVKSYNPGRVEQQSHISKAHSSNRTVQVFEDENQMTNDVMAGMQTPVRGAAGGSEHHQSIVQTILSSAKKHENLREPGPWNKAKLKTSRSIVGSSVNQKLPFDIMKDDDLIPLSDEQNMFKRGIQLFPGFVKKNLPQAEFEFPLHRDDDKNSSAMAGYDKFMLFPSADKCYSLEELWAYKWWKKQNISNDFTRTQDAIWGCGHSIPVRLPPYFRRRNEKQIDKLDLEPLNPKEVTADGSRRFAFNIDNIYTADNEYSIEELLQSRWLNGELASQRENEMELTCAFNRRESVFVSNVHRRSVALSGRQSILPVSADAPRKSILRKSIAPLPPLNNSPTFDVKPTFSRASAMADGNHVACNKRKSSTLACGSEEEVKSPMHFKRKLEEKQIADEKCKVEIFHADKETAFKEDKDVFKTPNLPPASRPRASSVYELGDDNEGCTTQTFNFFIKAQSVSTPKATEKPAQYQPSCEIQQRCKLFAENENQTPNNADSELLSAATVRQPFASRMPPDDVPSPSYPSPEMEINRHKLSAILETTEDANTISSAATISSKSSSSVEELRTIYEANSNGDSIISTTVASANKSSPLATIDETEDVHKGALAAETIKKNIDSPSVFEFKETKAEASAVSALPFEIYEDDVTNCVTGLPISEAITDELPSMCPINLIEDKTETIPQFLLNRNQTIESNSMAPFAEHTIPLPFLIPSIDESMEPNPEKSIEQPAASKTLTSDRSHFAIFEDDTASLLCPVDEATDEIQPKENETEKKNVSNLYNDQSILPLSEPLKTFSDSFSKLNLSSKSTMSIVDKIDAPNASICYPIDRTKFNIFQDECDKPMPPAIDDAATDISNFATIPMLTEQSICEAKNNLLEMTKNSKEKATTSSEKMSEPIGVTHPTVSKTTTDIDDEYYRMIQSPDTKFSKSVIAPSKPSIGNEFASTANDRSVSLLKPMKEISLTQHQKLDRSAAQLKPQATIPLAQFTFSEENPNTELFSLHMASIKNSTLLEQGPSPTPSTVDVPQSDTEAPSDDSHKKKGTAIDDEYYAFINSPVPAMRSNSSNPLTENPPDEMKFTSFDEQFYALINSPIPATPSASSQMQPLVSTQMQPPLDTNTIFDLSGIELNETEMKLMRKDLAECNADLSFPKFQISQPKTIRPSAFNRMTGHFTILDSPDESSKQIVHGNNTNDPAKHAIDDSSVFIVDPTEDLAANKKQYTQEQSSVNVSGASFRRGNQSAYERKGSVSIDYSQSQHIDPFDLNVQHAFLSDIDFVDYISKLENVYMVNRVRALQPDTEIAFGDKEFHVIKQIGHGSFGFVYSGRCLSTKKMYAFKQERPANLWEFYISLELHSRIEDQNILSGFLIIDFALIGSNSSVFASEYCSYGSLIDICNKHKEKTFRNLDELIVMILANQMLMIIDHMHGSNIIHADIKPDNFLMMKKLEYGNSECITLKLIDFGQSIDLNFYDQRQTFRTKLQTENFVCTEMMDDKPWTFQIDLFCVASTIYSMLCGKYMNVKKMPPNSLRAYTLSEPLPTHLDTQLWMNVMHTLINVRDCDSMPNLQSLRLIIKEAIHVRDRFLEEKIKKFNSIVDS